MDDLMLYPLLISVGLLWVATLVFAYYRGKANGAREAIELIETLEEAYRDRG